LEELNLKVMTVACGISAARNFSELGHSQTKNL
jgi:hypothetical protein